ncbi:MAG: hypothetical protein WCS73_10535 [Lentisphaeria bacterium]
MSEYVTKLKIGFVIIASSFFLTSCTIPMYERTVVKTYDGDGKLQSAVVTEHVIQNDPVSKPLLPVLEHQTYQKQP